MRLAKTFFTSDQHFGHYNIIKLAKRPHPSVEEMDDYMIEEWNKVVEPQDTVYHLGDFAWKAENGRKALSKLNGFIHLIEGNHELSSLYSQFQSVSQYTEVIINNQLIVLFHYPIRSWNGIFKGSWHLHGHTHNLLPIRPGKSLDIGVDSVGYQPLEFDQVAEYMSHRTLWTEETGFENYAEIKKQSLDAQKI